MASSCQPTEVNPIKHQKHIYIDIKKIISILL